LANRFGGREEEVSAPDIIVATDSGADDPSTDSFCAVCQQAIREPPTTASPWNAVLAQALGCRPPLAQ